MSHRTSEKRKTGKHMKKKGGNEKQENEGRMLKENRKK